ncbi:MAG TPA: hypothetical protein VFB02_08360 [Bradyrhizobium sp.]|nr:hypothetical protein [Bradyrhizobium sp.]
MDKAETIRLADALLLDLESPTASIDLILAKAYRLAEATGNAEAVLWLSYELHGYDSSTPVGRNYALLTQRWDGASDKGYFQSASDLAHTIETMTHTLQVHQQLQPSGDYAIVQQREKAEQVKQWAQAIAPMKKIISAVRAQILIFASRTRAEAQFSETSRSIFEEYQREVDQKLTAHAGQAFERFPSVFERLRHGDGEAISHALTSCRRIIDGFADAMFPTTDVPVQVDGQPLDCGKDKPRNRLRAYMAANMTSKSRRDRLNKNLNELYSKVSAGVHADVGLDEAKALVLNTYLFLGELALLKKG